MCSIVACDPGFKLTFCSPCHTRTVATRQGGLGFSFSVSWKCQLIFKFVSENYNRKKTQGTFSKDRIIRLRMSDECPTLSLFTCSCSCLQLYLCSMKKIFSLSSKRNVFKFDTFLILSWAAAYSSICAMCEYCSRSLRIYTTLNWRNLMAGWVVTTF